MTGHARDAVAGELRLVCGRVELFDAELASDHRALARLLRVGVIDAWPPEGGEHDASAVAFFRTTLLATPDAAPWLAYYVCVGDALVGSAGFLGPPDDGTAELGYSICERYRGRGFATRAVAALVARAQAAGVRRLIGHTAPGNAGSILVLQRNGFSPAPPDRPGELLFARELAA